MRVQETDWGYIEWMEPEYPGMGSEEASLRTGTVYVEPGKTMLRHVHYEEQFVYVLEGRGIGYINGEPQIFEPGARFHMPAGCTHEFVNTGDVPLVHLLVASPVSIDPDSLIDKTRPLPGSSANDQLYAAVEAVREAGIPDGALPRICISGCPSSCSGHQAAAIGFQGAAKTVDGKPESAFKMFVGGSDKLGAAKFGEAGAVILESDLPKFFVDLGKAVASQNMNWETWIAGHEDEFKKIVEKYA